MPEQRTVKIDATAVTTHLLHNRQSACGAPRGEPVHWPHGHVWVKLELAYLISCPKCQRLVPEIRGDKRR